jgi:hypothetical protein
MRKLWLDFETRSFIDLKACGLDRYAKDDTTEVLMLAWAYDDDAVKLWVPILGQPMPQEIYAGLIDAAIEKVAWNYNFEKDILQYKLGIAVPQAQWSDPSILCANMSLPSVWIGRHRSQHQHRIEEDSHHRQDRNLSSFSQNHRNTRRRS